MSAGKDILRAIRHRVQKTATSFQGRPVEVMVNPSGRDSGPEGLPPELLWKTQPHLRTVVDFLARNMAQLGLHCFVQDGEERERDRGSELAKILKRPNDFMTTYELIFDLVANGALHNRAYWFIHQGPERMEIHPFPAQWVTPNYKDQNRVASYQVHPPTSDKAVNFPAEAVVPFPGWSAEPGEESSPVETLRLILEEQHHSRTHRVQVWRRNGRVGSYLTRPAGAPEWDNTARARFHQMFEAFVGENGSRAGGTPMLEDGMELKRVGFNSADEQWAESVKLSLETVAQVYQVNPTMVGILDNANYSNAKEFNRTLYTNTLGPDLRRIEQRINAFVLPLLGASEDQFVEFNVAEKLRGSFEEQESILLRSSGGPFRTRAEARKMMNLPYIEGTDELITPLSVTEGGQSSPMDGGVDSGQRDTADEGKAREIVAKHVERVARIVPAKGFDKLRFIRELQADLSKAGCDPGLAIPVNDRIETHLNEGGSLEEAAFFDS